MNLESKMIRYACFRLRVKGFGLVEIIIAVAIAASLILGLGQVMQISLKLLREERMNMEAALLLQEGIEAMRMLRDASWSQYIAPMATGADYYLTATTTWGIWAVPQASINGRYTRVIRLDAVNRESGTDRIVASGGYADAGTRKLTVVVSWAGGAGTSSVSSVTYIANFLQN